MLVVALAALPAVPASAAPAGSSFSCRASAARVDVTAPTLHVEPVVANAANSPCRKDANVVLSPTTLGPLSVSALSAFTDQVPATLSSADLADGDHASAASGVTNPVVSLPGIALSANVLSASAAYTCSAGVATPSSTSQVVGLTLNGASITLPTNDAPMTIDLGPLGSINLNQTISAPGSVTRRALSIQTPLATVVVAEAVADLTANPCARAAVPPPPPAKNGTAKLTTIPSSIAKTVAQFGTGRCVNRAFVAVVTGQRIRRVVFTLDGAFIGSRAGSPARVAVRSVAGRIHTLRARVTFTDATSLRTLSLHFRACGPAAAPPVRRPAFPGFTG